MIPFFTTLICTLIELFHSANCTWQILQHFSSSVLARSPTFSRSLLAVTIWGVDFISLISGGFFLQESSISSSSLSLSSCVVISCAKRFTNNVPSFTAIILGNIDFVTSCCRVSKRQHHSFIISLPFPFHAIFCIIFAHLYRISIIVRVALLLFPHPSGSDSEDSCCSGGGVVGGVCIRLPSRRAILIMTIQNDRIRHDAMNFFKLVFKSKILYRN